MSQPEDDIQRFARHFNALTNGVQGLGSSLPDLVTDANALMKKIEDQKKEIAQLNIALDECSKLAKIDVPKK